MSNNTLEKEKIKLTPETGFNLVGIDYFGDIGNQLYIIEHFEMYQDGLNAKKREKIRMSILYCIKIKTMNFVVDE